MKFVLLVYQGDTPLPGSERWQALSETEQRAIYADYAELNRTAGVAPGLPLGLPFPSPFSSFPAPSARQSSKGS